MYSWGIDGKDRQHVCLADCGTLEVLLCVIPGCSVLDCIAMLEAQQ